MSSLKIQNMPLRIPVGTEKIPTGGFGDYSISVNYIADYTFTYKDLTTKTYVDTELATKINKIVQADSAATTVEELVADFNSLLAKLR